MKTDEQLKAENKAIRDMLATGPEAQLLALPGVVHVSVGLKETNRHVTDQLCIRVYVKEKRTKADLPASQLIPMQINGIPTDVNTVVGKFEFQVDNTRYRPIKGGIQITNGIIDIDPDVARGTLGCIAIDKTDNAPVLLSNWHLLFANTGTNGNSVFQPAPPPIADLSQLQGVSSLPNSSDKIGVIRRGVINDKVDGAIAAIDVSSCCHCCGIHYTNEINGLSVANRPPRNTIVGDERAVSGMTVFKVGQATLRTEGVVVDDNYPNFSVTKAGTSHSFTGQIAIQNIDHSLPFSNRGDSGSVIINLNNKIVGLEFAGARDLPVHGTQEPFISLANHISDVFSALNIRIEYSPDVVTVAGETLSDVPSIVFEAPIPEPYRVLRQRLQNNENTARLFALGQRHSAEVMDLINHKRPVTVAWHRSEGPAVLATVMSAVRDGHYRLPESVKGVTPYELLERMRAVLIQHGSAELKERLAGEETRFIVAVLKDCRDLHAAIECIAADQTLSSLLQGVGS